MAFLGDLGKAFGLGSTGDVAKAAALTYGTGNPMYAAGAFEGGSLGSQQGQSVAVDSPSQTVPQETQSSSANVGIVPPTMGGSLLGTGIQAIRPFLPAARNILQKPSTQIGIGLGVGAVADALMTPDGARIRITRKQQMQVKQMVELLGIEQAASILGLPVAQVAMIITKKFRSRGQGITAAQLRTATRVNNRIIHMHDKLKSAYGSAARRTTTRRSAGTRVTQIKN